MTGRRDSFVRFDANVKSKANLSNDSGMKVEDMRYVVIKRKDGE